MLTKVILDGPLGERFGREWELAVDSPNEALRIIDANVPGVFTWIKQNLQKHSHYQVVCEYENGAQELLGDDDYQFMRKCKSIRFVPVIAGSGGVARFVAGVVLIVVGLVTEMPMLVKIGASLAIGGAISMLSPKPKKNSTTSSEANNLSSFYFNGPVNTTEQGVPVSLIYGRCLVGSHTISAAVTIDDLL